MTWSHEPSNMGDRVVSPGAILWMVDDNTADLEIAGIICESICFPGHVVPFISGQEVLSRLTDVWRGKRDGRM